MACDSSRFRPTQQGSGNPTFFSPSTRMLLHTEKNRLPRVLQSPCDAFIKVGRKKTFFFLPNCVPLSALRRFCLLMSGFSAFRELKSNTRPGLNSH